MRERVFAAWVAVAAAALAAPVWPAGPPEEQQERGRAAIAGMTGCYLVDYSHVETEGLQPGYRRDGRVYDVNRDKSVKEWIWAEAVSPRRIRLQRVLFITELSGALRPGSVIRHQAEDWEHEAPFLYEFVAPRTWHVQDLRASPGLWTRRVTNLDDGLRHQCAARWRLDTGGRATPIRQDAGGRGALRRARPLRPGGEARGSGGDSGGHRTVPGTVAHGPTGAGSGRG